MLFVSRFLFWNHQIHLVILFPGWLCVCVCDTAHCDWCEAQEPQVLSVDRDVYLVYFAGIGSPQPVTETRVTLLFSWNEKSTTQNKTRSHIFGVATLPAHPADLRERMLGEGFVKTFSFLLKCSFDQRVKKWPTIPIPKAIKQLHPKRKKSGKNLITKETWQKMIHPSKFPIVTCPPRVNNRSNWQA